MSAISPRIRRQARERALQFLFGLEFTKYEWEGAIEAFWNNNPSRPGAKRYARRLIQGVMENLDALDADIERTVDNWAPERIGRVERNVLRIALYEIRCATDVPPNVAINEAVEIAKRFGAGDAPRFVNGILDRLKENGPRTSNS